MGNGFHLIPAHSVETLADAFSEQIARRENPLRTETVLVMNHAQGVWLRRFLAQKIGICANIRFLSPERFLENLVVAEKSVFSQGALTWRIFEKLHAMRDPAAGTPREFLFESNGETDADDWKLARRLGDLFWRYQSFRPQMIRDWTNDAPDPQNTEPDFLREYRRQKNLWREILPAEETPPAVAWLNFLENEKSSADAPPRIFAFAPSALPRIHFDLLKKLSETSEVFLYFHNLSTDLWTESPDEKKRLRERVRANAKKRQTPRGNENAPVEPDGCELIAAWGKAARPLARQLVDDGLLDAESNLDAAPAADSLLRALQRNIRKNAPIPEKFVPAENDCSLKISIAPDPLREMEILRDELTAHFAKDPQTTPGDVLIMLADIKTYAPFVYSVFENSGIPFSVADQAETSPSAEKFLEILRVARGEIRLDETLALLDSAVIQNALAIDGNVVAALRETLADAGIRWGTDCDFRRERIFGNENFSPETESLAENNSWEFGLRRLALGYALGREDGETHLEKFGDIDVLPVPGLTEAAPDALGKVAKLARILTELNRVFSGGEKRSVPAWREYLQSVLLENFLDANPDGAGDIRKILFAMENDARAGAFSPENPAECDLDGFLAALEMQDWSGARNGSGMLRGKVTFCEMRPMRNIPAKIIGIAGLNDGAFPHVDSRNSADLIFFSEKNFPAGTALWDRSRRDDDCLLFLESILAAKTSLLLSYVGRDANDGQPLPPCVPLAKLRDYLLKISAQENAGDAGAPSFETRHRLHGFSPEYFSSDSEISKKFFSFSRPNFATAGNSATANDDGFAKNFPPLSARERDELSEISASEFIAFFRSPAKFICRNRLGVAEPPQRDVPESDDPADFFSPLDVADFHRELVEKILSRKPADNVPDECFFRENLQAFRTRAIFSGSATTLVRENEFEQKLEEKIKDRDCLFSAIPKNICAVEPKEIPPALEFEIDAPEIPLPRVRINLNFGTLFRRKDGGIFLPLFGKKNIDWRTTIETFVNAQLLAEAFPKDDFSVAYFAYGQKEPSIITRQTLEKSGISLCDLVRLYAAGTVKPMMIFQKMPNADEADSDKSFSDKIQNAWNAADSAEVFVFGENAPKTFRENILSETFPFARAVVSAFEKKPEKTGKNKAARKR